MRANIRELIRRRRAIATTRTMVAFNQSLAESRLVYARNAGLDHELPVLEERRASAVATLRDLAALYEQNESTLRTAMGRLGNWVERGPPTPRQGLSQRALQVLAWCAAQAPDPISVSAGDGESVLLLNRPGDATIDAHTGIVDDLLDRKYLAATERRGSTLAVTTAGWKRLYQEGEANLEDIDDAAPREARP